MEVGVLEAKNRLSELIERAEQGEKIVITRHGQPAVEFTPVRKRLTEQELGKLMADVRNAKKSLPKITRADILQTIKEGRDERFEQIARR